MTWAMKRIYGHVEGHNYGKANMSCMSKKHISYKIVHVVYKTGERTCKIMLNTARACRIILNALVLL